MDIITEDGQAIDFDQYHKLEVKATDGTPRWQLIARRTTNINEVVCIAHFDSTDEANAAKRSLTEAKLVGNAWDAAEFKEKYKKPRLSPTVRLTKSRKL